MGRREALLTEAQEHQEAMSQVIQLQLTPKGCTGCMLETSIKMLPKEDERCQHWAPAILRVGPLRKVSSNRVSTQVTFELE